MSDSYTNLLYHVIFSTKHRRPLITPDYEVRLYDYVGGTGRSLGGISLELMEQKITFIYSPSSDPIVLFLMFSET